MGVILFLLLACGPGAGWADAPHPSTTSAEGSLSKDAPSAEVEPPPAASPADAVNSPVQDGGAFDTIDEQVRQLVARARTSFNAGQYAVAAQELEAAYKLKPNANYLFSIAQCQRRAGHHREARSLYQRFLSESPETPLKLETTNYISELNILITQDDAIEKERKRPVWKKPWFWGVVGSATVAAAVALGVGLGVGLKDKAATIGFSFPMGSTASALTRSGTLR
jgi:tetratricopeptide (TPR) repeat protein